MFSFSDPNPKIIEHKVNMGEMQKKHHDKYIITINHYLENFESHGDVVAILTPEEYRMLDKPKPMAPKYGVWKGVSLALEGLGAYGFYM